jgi:GNAT superfamily N-acetyltransferase
MYRKVVLVERATMDDVEAVRTLDRLLPGLRDRSEALLEWIARGECLVARREGELAGFAVANASFFAQCFIVLLVVHPSHRRRGVASALIRRVEATSPTAKLFTSTNRSNRAMQAVCHSLGFVPSGIIENLDEDDPELVYFKRLR